MEPVRVVVVTWKAIERGWDGAAPAHTHSHSAAAPPPQVDADTNSDDDALKRASRFKLHEFSVAAVAGEERGPLSLPTTCFFPALLCRIHAFGHPPSITPHGGWTECQRQKARLPSRRRRRRPEAPRARRAYSPKAPARARQSTPAATAARRRVFSCDSLVASSCYTCACLPLTSWEKNLLGEKACACVKRVLTHAVPAKCLPAKCVFKESRQRKCALFLQGGNRFLLNSPT